MVANTMACVQLHRNRRKGYIVEQPRRMRRCKVYLGWRSE